MFPFISLSQGPNGPRVRGEVECKLGHRFAVAGLEEAQGLFAEWHWDGTRLEARVDRLGFYNLFYCETDDGIIVSPSTIQLVAEGAPATLDEPALSVFFRIGLFLGEATPFREIRALPPGGHLVWENGQSTVSGEVPLIPEASISRAQAVDGFVDLTHQAVGRGLRSWDGEFVLPLSGGRDSRHLLFEMQRHDRLPSSCVTFHYGRGFLDEEAEPAHRVAEAIGVPHVLLNQRRSRHHDTVRAIVATHLCSDEHAQMMQLGDYCQSTGGAVLDGIAGDVLSRNQGFTNEANHEACRAGDFRAVARQLIVGHRVAVGAAPEDVFGAEEMSRRFPEEQAVEDLAAAVALHADAADPFTAFLFWHRTRREISLVPTAVHVGAPAVLCPYVDSELHTFLASLPFDVTRDARLHDEAIARAFPQYAELPYQEQVTERTSRTPMWHRLLTVREALSMTARLSPAQIVGSPRAALGFGLAGIPRKIADFLRYYRACVDDLDATKARHLLRVSEALQTR